MIIEIQVQPAPDVPRFETSILLEGRRWTFVFYTNTTDDSWCFDLIGDDELPRFYGQGVASGVDLFFPYRYRDVPPGILFVNDQADTGRDPRVDSFQEQQTVLYYVTSDDPALA